MTIKTVNYFLDSVVEEIEEKSKISVFLNPPNGNSGRANILWVELIEIENLSNEIMFSYNISFDVRIFIFYTYHLKNSHQKVFETMDAVYKSLCVENLSKVISGYSILGVRNTKVSIKRPDSGSGSDSFRLDMHYNASIRQSLSISDLRQDNVIIPPQENNNEINNSEILLIQNEGNV